MGDLFGALFKGKLREKEERKAFKKRLFEHKANLDKHNQRIDDFLAANKKMTEKFEIVIFIVFTLLIVEIQRGSRV